MKKDIKIDKKIVIVITIIVSIIMTYSISKIFITKKEDKEIIKEVKKDKTFAIMIQSGDAYKEYTSKDNKWPDDNYIFSKAECIDNSGNRIEDAITFNNETRKATLKSKKTIYCTLYFDESNIIKLRENEKSINKNNLSSDLQGGMYRYQGTDNVANWICFGTEDNCGTNDELIDKYMYRIIGITPNGELYLIKETFIKERKEDNTYVNGFVWNDKFSIDSSSTYYCENGICPEWPDSLLFKRINGISNGSTIGSGTVLNQNWTNIFVDSNEYEYMAKENKWYNLIEEHNWMYGETIDSPYNGNKAFQIETGQASTSHYVGTVGNIKVENYTWPITNNVLAKISLMHWYDYIYSYYDKANDNSRGNPASNATAKNSWLYYKKNQQNSLSAEWMMTKWGIGDAQKYAIYARTVSDVSDNSSHSLREELGVRPVFYLSPKATISSGNGTKSNPYILDIQE